MRTPRPAPLLASLRAAFDRFDADHNGRIDAGELRRALAAMGVDASAAEVRKMLSLHDDRRQGADQARALDFDDFVDLLDPDTEELASDASPERAFDLLDADGDGFLDHAELVAAADGGLDRGAFDRLLEAADLDRDGRLGRAEAMVLLAEPAPRARR